MSGPRKDLDWEAIERDYCSGQFTDRQIAARNGTTHATVGNRAKAEKWTKDLSAKIHASARAKLSKSLLTKELSKNKKEADRELVEVSSNAVTELILSHRKDIRRSRELSKLMLAEMEAQCENPADFQKLGELLKGDNTAEINKLFQRVISLPGRIDGAKKLAETLKLLVSMEREAFNVDDEQPANTDLSSESVAELRRLKAALERD
ncbi:conserved hypothetical protein [Candidatus Propionivibrio aalborgensis]|uniref:Terminase small subunit n=1 Tax=Candidatus Propionivibrio aalborgensis TaxID=1860101 RepID=A0A1A8Y0I2_9RHOO|nr:hypothetical protein [Candidatus Propionivibrio aalborgensis]SBT10670.1 conserved hypothetical protein [Candidatus Propionivibrio aalborgensis]